MWRAFRYTLSLGFSLYQCYLSRLFLLEIPGSWLETLACECFILANSYCSFTVLLLSPCDVRIFLL